MNNESISPGESDLGQKGCSEKCDATTARCEGDRPSTVVGYPRPGASQSRPADRLLKSHEVEEILGVSRHWLDRNKRLLAGVRVKLSSGSVRYKESALWTWINIRAMAGGQR